MIELIKSYLINIRYKIIDVFINQPNILIINIIIYIYILTLVGDLINLFFNSIELTLVNDLNIKNLYLFNHSNIISNALYSVLRVINNVNICN